MKHLLYFLFFFMIFHQTIAQPIGTEFRVNSYTTDNQNAAVIAKNFAGNTVIIWESAGQDGSDAGIFGQCFDQNGDELGDEFQINTTTTGDQSKPSVAIDGGGNFVVVWESDGQDGSFNGIFGQRFNVIGQKQGAEFQVNSTTNDDQVEARIAMNTAGDFVVVWQSFGQDGSGSGIYGQRYHADGSVVGSEFQVNTTTSNEQQFPDVAMDEDGNFVVIWQSFGQDGDGWGVFGQRYDATGMKVGTSEFQVNTATTNQQEQADIAMRSNGEFIVAWQSTNQVNPSSDTDIYAQRYDASGNTIGVEFLVNTSTDNYNFGQNNPDVIIDTTGNFLIAWDGSGAEGGMTYSSSIFAKEYDSNGNAIDEQFLVNTNTNNGPTRSNPQAAIDANGDYHITWQSNQSGTDEVYAQAYFTGTEEAFLVNNTILGFQSWAAIAKDKDGNFVVVWSGNGIGDSEGIFGQRYDVNGTKLGDEFLVNSNPSFSQSSPDIAMDEDGDFVVVWASRDQDGSDWGVFGQRFQANGNKEGSEFLVNTTTAGIQWRAAVTMDDVGNFIVVWDGNGVGDDLGIFGQRYDDNGLAQGSEFLVNSYTTNRQAKPTVAMNNDGLFVVAWESRRTFQVNLREKIYAQNFDANGNKVSTEFYVGTNAGEDYEEYTPSVDMDEKGNFIIVWENITTSNDRTISGRYYLTGNTVGNLQIISSSSTFFEKSLPSISINKNGEAVVVWSSLNQINTNSSYDVFGQRFNTDFQKIGGEFQVNTYTTNSQGSSDIVLCENNDFVVVWSGEGIGDFQGVFGKQYKNKFKTTARYYVDDSATGNNGGTDWTNAFTTLSDAIEVAKKFDDFDTEIWVAEGTYFPQDSAGVAPLDTRERTFYFNFDIKVYGGFAGTPGTEGDLSAQDWQTYPTILSGDFAQDDPSDIMDNDLTFDDCRQENAYHVVRTQGVSDNFLMNGFYIQGGNANGSNDSDDSQTQGGGWLNRLDNFSSSLSEPVIKNCHFSKNSSRFRGGAFYNVVTTGALLSVKAKFINCIFDNNHATIGAAIQNNSINTLSIATVYVINSIFTRNSSSNSTSCISSTSTNSVDELSVTNCSFSANKTDNFPAVLGATNYTVYNSIFWGNSNRFGARADLDSSFGEVYNSIVENDWTGMGSSNSNADPLFIYPPNLEYAPFESGNLRLQNCSPALDAGDNAAPDLVGITTDLDGNERIYGGTLGTVAVVDMGAYELQEAIMPATTIVCYRDLDSDTYGNPLDSAFFCSTCGVGYVSDSTDCNDDPQNGGAIAFPGNPEICFDFIDNDCNGLIDETCCPIDTILYVDQAATGNNDGSDWANAFTDLQTALSFAKFADCNISQIWVAQGTYYPSLDKEGDVPTKNPRLATFFIDFDIEIYGGFKGTESSLAERNWLSNSTILSGDIGIVEDSTDNVFNIICTEGTGMQITLDGFEIRRGNADGEDFINRNGAAWYNARATVSARNCTFKNNTTNNNAGALYNEESDINITNCVFHDNKSIDDGGAIYFGYFEEFNPKILNLTNCGFWNNSSSRGGGISVNYLGTGFGGTDTSLYVVNCTFSENTALAGGTGNAGAIFFQDAFSYGSVKNSILWKNDSPEILTPNNAISVINSIVQDGYGGGITNINPRFVLPPDDLRLKSNSGARDIGTNVFNTTSTDLDELPRITNSIIDLGAYEYCDPQVICYRDLDGDTFGDSTVTRLFCGSCGMGYVSNNTDCNDNPNNGGAAAFPNNPEIIGDGIDNDCDGMIDENDIICEGVNLNLTDDISDTQEHNAQQFLMANNTITNTGDATYTAGDSIVLKVGFEAIGAFHAYIADCDLPSNESLENRSLTVKTALALDIYPNPFSQRAIIHFEAPTNEVIQLTIFNLSGKLMQQIGVDHIGGKQEISIDANHFPSGIYWLRMQTATGILTKKFSVVKD